MPNGASCIAPFTMNPSVRAPSHPCMHASMHAPMTPPCIHPCLPACMQASMHPPHPPVHLSCIMHQHHHLPGPGPSELCPPPEYNIYICIYMCICVYIYIYPPTSSGARALSHSDPLIPSNPANSNQQLPQYLATGHHRLPSLPATYIARCRLPYGTILKE